MQVEPITLRIPLPKSGFSAPNLPELNHSQLHAVRSVLQQPLSLIQVSGVALYDGGVWGGRLWVARTHGRPRWGADAMLAGLRCARYSTVAPVG